jgi:serine/threonine protein kinase
VERYKRTEKLDYAPLTQEEWESKNMREVPKNFVKDSTGKKMAKLGNGGCMTVYRMKNTEGKFFAVKTVEESEETRVHVEREAFTLERMKHRHVIRYYRIHENDDEGEVGIVMEWAQGGSLADLIKARKKRSQKVGTSELLEINIQMATALDYVHGEGVLHRDVKADNVLLANADGGKVCIKLADFGVAAVLTHTPLTKSQTAGKGTERYYSPEKARSKAYGSKADMWAVGCIIIELACCDILIGALWSVDDLEVQDRRNKYFAQVDKRCPGLANIVHNLLDSDAACRRSASELRRPLEKLKLAVDSESDDGRPLGHPPKKSAAKEVDNPTANEAPTKCKVDSSSEDSSWKKPIADEDSYDDAPLKSKAKIPAQKQEKKLAADSESDDDKPLGAKSKSAEWRATNLF